MTDKLHESISALMDDEANEIELHRVLSKMDDDGFRNTWKRYQVIRAVMKGQTGDSLNIDISKNISAAIENQELTIDETLHPSPATNTNNLNSNKSGFTKPLTSVAVAASVAFLVVFGVSQFDQNNNNAVSPVEVAEQQQSTISPANVIAAGNQVESPEMTPLDPERLSNVHKRLRLLMNRHTQQADISLGRGVIPSAQLVNAEEQGGY